MKRNLYKSMVLILFSVFILGAPAFGAPALYDNFSGPFIESENWFPGDHRAFVREVDAENEKLVSKIANAHGNGMFRNRTPFQNPNLIDAIECEITVVHATLDTTGTDPRSFASIEGFFYNAQPGEDATGDIWAAVYLGNLGAGPEARWIVIKFLDDDLITYEVISEGALIEAGELEYEREYTAKIVYNGNNAFEFSVDEETSGALVFDQIPFIRDSFNQYKGLTTGIDADGGSGTGYASATFDDVEINESGVLYDNFSIAPLDQTRWKALEFVREISGDEKLRLNAQADEAFEGAYVQARYHTTPYLEAEVLVETGSDVIGATGFARVRGFYYNDSRGPGSGKDYNGTEGDVFAYTGIILHEGAHLSAISKIYRCDDSGDWKEIFAHPFSTEIKPDTPYTLSIEFTGTSLIFTCEDETRTYEITTPIYRISTGQMRRLESWVFAEEEQSGHIKATFDDVYTGCTVEPTYDASGTWDFSTFEAYNECPGAIPEPDDTGTLTITQPSGDTFELEVDGDVLAGTICGEMYKITWSYKADNPLGEPGTVTELIVITLSSGTSGFGIYRGTWVADDGSFRCSWGSAITVTKQAGGGAAAGGGGGGCFIDTAGSEFRR